MPRSRLLRATARLWWLRIYTQSGGVPSPRDAPAIRSHAADPDRVLIIGNGAARGWGVATYGLALAGRLADAVGRATGRPCDVDQIGDEAMNVASAPAWIGSRALDGYDVVLVVLGFGDALRQLPVQAWRQGLERLLDTVRAGTGPSVPILVAGIEPISSAPVFHGPLGRLGQRHADRLNAATRAVTAGRDGIRFIELPGSGPRVRARGASTAYLDWAGHLAEVVAPTLDQVRSAPREPGTPVPDPQALAVPYALGGDLTALRGLLEEARSELSADLAWVGLQAGERQVIALTTVGLPALAVPADLTFCRYTVERNDTFVVPDVNKDPRFAGNPFLDVLHLESYVGHPLRDADGTVIGTICVASVKPKSSFTTDGGALERYARSAETELVRIEAGEEEGVPS